MNLERRIKHFVESRVLEITDYLRDNSYNISFGIFILSRINCFDFKRCEFLVLSAINVSICNNCLIYPF